MKIDVTNYEEFFIRFVENDLSAGERKDVLQFLEIHPQLKSELEAFQATILPVDESIVFPNKAALKKPVGGRVIPVYWTIGSVAIAASLALFFVLRNNPFQQTSSTQPIAENTITNQSENSSSQSTNTFSSQSQTTVAATSSENSGNNVKQHLVLASNNHVYPQQNNTVVAINTVREGDVTLQTIPSSYQNSIAYKHKSAKAPYLIIERGNETQHATANEENRNTPAWLSVASVVGSELLKLSGRGDLLKDEPETRKIKLPLDVTIDSKKFSFHHTFGKKKNSSNNKNQTL